MSSRQIKRGDETESRGFCYPQTSRTKTTPRGGCGSTVDPSVPSLWVLGTDSETDSGRIRWNRHITSGEGQGSTVPTPGTWPRRAEGAVFAALLPAAFPPPVRAGDDGDLGFKQKKSFGPGDKNGLKTRSAPFLTAFYHSRFPRAVENSWCQTNLKVLKLEKTFNFAAPD